MSQHWLGKIADRFGIKNFEALGIHIGSLTPDAWAVVAARTGRSQAELGMEKAAPRGFL